VKKTNIYILLAIIAGVLVFFLCPRPKGFIKIETSGVDMLISKGWFQNVRITSEGNPVKVTVGTYRPKNIYIKAGKDNDKLWTIFGSSGPWGELSKIKVEKDKTTAIALGPPFTIKTDVQRNGRNVLIGLSLIGRSGEYWNPQVSLNKGQVMAPKLSIIDEAGKILASGSFQFG
jgi:hypothetical protein